MHYVKIEKFKTIEDLEKMEGLLESLAETPWINTDFDRKLREDLNELRNIINEKKNEEQ